MAAGTCAMCTRSARTTYVCPHCAAAFGRAGHPDDAEPPNITRTTKNFIGSYRSGGRMIKLCGLVCCVAYPYALAILCPVASVALLINNTQNKG